MIVVNHPAGLINISDGTARRHIADGKAQLVDGVLYWRKVRRRGDSDPRAIVTHLDRRRPHAREDWRVKQSGYAGPVVLQMEQGQ